MASGAMAQGVIGQKRLCADAVCAKGYPATLLPLSSCNTQHGQVAWVVIGVHQLLGTCCWLQLLLL